MKSLGVPISKKKLFFFIIPKILFLLISLNIISSSNDIICFLKYLKIDLSNKYTPELIFIFFLDLEINTIFFFKFKLLYLKPLLFLLMRELDNFSILIL